jgi:hypothetical protein
VPSPIYWRARCASVRFCAGEQRWMALASSTMSASSGSGSLKMSPPTTSTRAPLRRFRKIVTRDGCSLGHFVECPSQLRIAAKKRNAQRACPTAKVEDHAAAGKIVPPSRRRHMMMPTSAVKRGHHHFSSHGHPRARLAAIRSALTEGGAPAI